MTERHKYDFERLDKYCNENNVVLLEDYSKDFLTKKVNIKFYCEKCDFGCFGEILLNRHLETQKHLNL